MALNTKLAMGTSLLYSKLTGTPIPFMVNWAITGRCNLRCTHCYGDYGETQSAELPLPLIKETIDELKQMGTRRFTIEGGEPLFRSDVEEILTYIKAYRLEQSLCTNGIYLKKFIDVVEKCVDLLIFSLDGQEAFHDKVRGKLTYKKTIEAMELARKRNIRQLLFCTLIDENIKDIEHVVDLAREYGTSVTFNIAVAKVNESGSGERTALNKMQDEKYKEAIKKIVELKKKGAPIFYSMKNYNQVLNWPDFQKEKYWPEDLDSLPSHTKAQMIPCWAGRRFLYIECNGDVYPCYQMVGTMKVKNIEKDGIKKAFYHLNQSRHCTRCYNLTLSELNLQANLDVGSILQTAKNYLSKK